MMLWRLLLLIPIIVNGQCEDKGISGTIGNSNKYKVLTSVDLPDIVRETSGLQLFGPLVLTINDSGNEPEIYGIQTENGQISRIWKVKNARNKDWEALTSDEHFLYIGDFGNNLGIRKDLVIYKIPLTELTSFDVVNALEIRFAFEDQGSFLPSLHNHPFDCEAMVSIGDSLVLFTKDWKNNLTTAYFIPKKQGDYAAIRKFEFDAQGLITDADYYKQDSVLLLCGYKNYNPFLWKIEGINFNDGTFSKATKYDITEYSGIQNEGISFFSKDSLYMTSEAQFIKQKLFLIYLRE